MFTRAEDENLHVDPCCNLNGIPVMLKVPSHLEVKITETLYAVYDQDVGDLHVIPLDHPDLAVAAELKYTEKMFLLDPVKVGAGAGGYGLGFGPAKDGDKPGASILGEDGLATGHGYLHSANYKADDQTIIQSANLLSAVLNFNKVKTAFGSSGNILDTTQAGSATKINRVVAYRRFDLASPGVNDEVYAFLEEHLNRCNACSKLPSANRGVISRKLTASSQHPASGTPAPNPALGTSSTSSAKPADSVPPSPLASAPVLKRPALER
jgi:hypothetical protein